MTTIEVNGKRYRLNKLPRAAHLMTEEWVARFMGLPLDVLEEIKNGAEVKYVD